MLFCAFDRDKSGKLSEDYLAGGFLMKNTLIILATSLFGFGAISSEITPQTLIGNYSIQVKYLTKKADFNLFVLTTDNFQIQRVYPDHQGKICSGKYTISSDKVFLGKFVCPDDQQTSANFDIEFGSNTMDNLSKGGAKVRVKSDAAPGKTLNGKMSRW